MCMTKESDGLVGHGSILLAATVITGIANYFFHFYMVRALSYEDYGILFSLLAIVMVLSVPATSIHTVITKYVSKFRARNENGKIAFLFFHSTKKLLFFGTLLLVIFILLSGQLSSFLKIPSRIPVVVVGFVLLSFFIVPVPFGTLQGLQKFTFLGVSIILASILRVLFGIFLVRLGFSVNGALAASFFSGVIAFLIVFVPLSIFYKGEQIDRNIQTGEMYKFFLPTLLALGSLNIITYIDVPLVKHFFSPSEAGFYSTAALLGKAFLFPPMALAAAMFPKVSGYGNESRFLLNNTLLFSVLLLILGILVCLFFPKFILTVLEEKKDLTPLFFSTTIPLLRLFGIAMSPFALTNVLIYYNLARHETKFLYFLLPGALLQIIVLSIFHMSLLQVVFILGVSGFMIFTFLFLLTYRTRVFKTE